MRTWQMQEAKVRLSDVVSPTGTRHLPGFGQGFLTTHNPPRPYLRNILRK